MPIYTYRQFTPDSDDMNVPGSSDVTKPSEGWKGRDANDALRATNSALKNLGDEAAKLPRNADGSVNYGPNGGDGRLGTAAFQDNSSFDNIVLGPSVRGSIGPNILIMGVCFVSEVNTLYADQRTRGFDLCDGRLTTDPYPPFSRQIRMPNFMGRFPWFADVISNVLTTPFGIPIPSGENTITYQQQLALSGQRVITVGNHSHGGVTGGSTLGYAQLPPVVTNVGLNNAGTIPAGGTRGLDLTVQGSSGTHAHAIGPDGGFSTGNIDIRPPAIAVLPFLRVW